MLTRPRVIFAAIALVAVGCSAETGSPPQLSDLAANAGPAAAHPAPDFSVTTFDGEPFTLSGHLAGDGRPVFLNLWASWCGPCRAEMPDIDAAASRNPDVLFIGVAVQDTMQAARNFADEIGVAYRVGFDESGEVDKGYSPVGLPATFIISSDGQIAERVFGPLTAQEIEEKLADILG
jgi:thiol-disulfide isomerase/thioredoxin